MISDPEIEAIQDYANSVSIKRLNYNDHGPVHMRQVAVNVVKMLSLLKQDGVKTSLEIEEAGSHEDSLCALLLAAFLHDLGMSVGRSNTS